MDCLRFALLTVLVLYFAGCATTPGARPGLDYPSGCATTPGARPGLDYPSGAFTKPDGKPKVLPCMAGQLLCSPPT